MQRFVHSVAILLRFRCFWLFSCRRLVPFCCYLVLSAALLPFFCFLQRIAAFCCILVPFYCFWRLLPAFFAAVCCFLLLFCGVAAFDIFVAFLLRLLLFCDFLLSAAFVDKNWCSVVLLFYAACWCYLLLFDGFLWCCWFSIGYCFVCYTLVAFQVFCVFLLFDVFCGFASFCCFLLLQVVF